MDDSEKDDIEDSAESPSQLLPLLALLHRHLMSVCTVKSSATRNEVMCEGDWCSMLVISDLMYFSDVVVLQAVQKPFHSVSVMLL